ncbi:MAG: signal peptide peptidase SppA [Tannerella sp.]|jgi:protease-4|nr:signal peptide peptidase SppA [Tannerella sp.]
MKQFFKMMFASTLGVILAVVLLSTVTGLLTIAMCMSIGSKSGTTPILSPGESVFKLSLSGAMLDSPADRSLSLLLGEDETLSLKDVLTAIRNAREQSAIQGIYLDLGVLQTGTASIDAIRRALTDFRGSGKFIVAYADNYSQGSYFLASVADEVYLNPQGLLGLTGIASQTLFYRGLLEKAGIEMNVFKVGTYKGAVEPFMSDQLSDANREQITSYITGLWGHVVNGIAESRQVPASTVSGFADEGLFFAAPSKAMESRLIDGLKFRSEVENLLKEKAGQTGQRLKTVSLSKMKKLEPKARKYRNKVAVVYAEGEITAASMSSPYQGEKYITEALADELRKLREDEQVKAVVLRVNSPGGSAFISEQIWKEVSELKKTKPVVVSMGNMAASGGYYIACAANKIVAEANTLTGSIGVFGIFPNLTGLFGKLALGSEVVKTGKYADLGNLARPMMDEEKALIQGYVERCYQTFLTRCSDGRGMSTGEIDALGQGRIWRGEQALEAGLVDELGGLDRAIDLAVNLAGIYNYTLITAPAPKDFILELLKKQLDETKVSLMRDMAGEDYEYFKTLRRLRSTYGIQARIPYDLKPL